MITFPGCYGCTPRKAATWRAPRHYMNSCDTCHAFMMTGPGHIPPEEWQRVTRWQLARFYIGELFREISWHRLATKIEGQFWN